MAYSVYRALLYPAGLPESRRHSHSQMALRGTSWYLAVAQSLRVDGGMREATAVVAVALPERPLLITNERSSMSEIKILNGFHIDVAHEKQPRATPPEDGNGQPTVETVDVWTIVLTERAPPTGNQYRISFERDSRDEIVRKLTGGIVLAGGELPRL